MSTDAQPGKAAWNRRMTAAKRSLKLVIEASAQHLGLLESNPPQLPESSFLAHAVKYDQALGELRLLALLGEDTDAGGNGDDDGQDAPVHPVAAAIQNATRAGIAAAQAAQEAGSPGGEAGFCCPSCGSPDPRWHPSAGDGGEVTRICPDPYHTPVPDEVRAIFTPVPRDLP